MYRDTRLFCVNSEVTLREVICRMNENCLGIVIVTKNDHSLLGTVTDGDIRRAVLAHIPLTSSVLNVLEQKKGTSHEIPLSAPEGQNKGVYLRLLKQHRLSHLPIVNNAGQVTGLVKSDEYIESPLSGVNAVVMGKGKQPLLKTIIERLKSAGIRKVNVKKLLQGSSVDFDLAVKEPTLVVNGDILTDVDYNALFRFHREHEAVLTVGVRVYDFSVPYGVIEFKDVEICAIKEKPNMKVFVNAGVYLMEPSVREYIPKGKKFNIKDLIDDLVKKEKPVVSFPIHEYWLDTGKPEKFEEIPNKAEGENL